jgi:hypothetical protein
MKFASLCTALAVAALAPSFAHAAADDSGFHPLVGTAITYGGDDLATVEFESGGSRTIKAGNLVQIHAGAEYRVPNSPLSFEATIGYHFDNVSAENGSLRFDRFPIEAILLWAPEAHWRLGVGARYAMSARLSSSGASDIGNYDIKAQVGALLMGEWRITPSHGVQIRYVHETYKLNGVSIDGSHAGVGYNYYF